MSAIYMLPLGDVDGNVLGSIERAVRGTFGLKVRCLSAEQVPAFAFDAVRHQYSSELVLRNLVRRCPHEAFRLLAVTDVDLFIPMLTFVFGQAQLNGKVSIVSTARMYQEFYALSGNPALTLERIRKESVHELGHTFGLTHCSLPSCLMSIAAGVDQLDAKGDKLCDGCSHVLRDALARASKTMFEQP